MFWMSIIVYQFYTSVLVFTLIGTIEKSPIKVLEQLRNSKITIALDDSFYVKSFVEVNIFNFVNFFYSFISQFNAIFF